MTTIASELRRYRPAILMDRVLPRKRRRKLRWALALKLVLLMLIMGGFIAHESFISKVFEFGGIFESNTRFVAGIFFILLAPYVALLQLSFFYNTLYFRGTKRMRPEDLSDGTGITLEVATVFSNSGSDLTRGFLTSPYGKEFVFRTGIEHTELDLFLRSERTRIEYSLVELKEGSFLSLEDIGVYLYEHDHFFKDFLFRHGVSDIIFRGTIEWISRMRMLMKYGERWWSRDNLGRIRGLGRELSYGVAYDLQRYMRTINTTAVLSLFSNDSAYAHEIIEKIEAVLARTKAANVILVGEPGVGKMDMLIELARKIEEGRSVASVTGKHLIVFDRDAFIATHNTKEEFEFAFLKLMMGAEAAGNIIIVIENISAFLLSVEAIGVDAGDLLSRFLTSPSIQIIATSDPSSFHEYMERKPQFLQHFEKVLVENPDLTSTIRVLEDALPRHEHAHKIFFTYPALARIAESADQYIVEGVMPDKAVSLLAEVASQGGQRRLVLIKPDFVDECVSKKTGIKTGPILEREKDMLIHLEGRLHERVVGQHDAIQAIASAMRRSRAGIQDKGRPIGSFLFLGSTGVGKTETAKALARVFFESEERMIRFDMSEYSDATGLERLLGGSAKAGALSTTLREHPYGVLLLDEFEKASSEVHDLFLQVLDEGMFTDSMGKRVNARNSIIIATSNAGSDLIWELVKDGKRPTEAKDTIIGAIIERSIFKPELINRFDAVVIFESLSEVQQEKIAGLMLKELQARIRERGYELVVDNVLIRALMRAGYDPEFGARPMRRALQDIIEEKIAEEIIEGDLRPGDAIHFEEGDFA